MDIICINDNFSPEQIPIFPNRPVKDKIYSIRDVIKSTNGIGLLLNEIVNPHNGWTEINGEKFTFEPSFNIERFVDLQYLPLNVNALKKQVTV